jgi:hypothetical protein
MIGLNKGHNLRQIIIRQIIIKSIIIYLTGQIYNYSFFLEINIIEYYILDSNMVTNILNAIV